MIEEVTQSKNWGEAHTGMDHTCGLKLDGRTFCCGAGNGSVGKGPHGLVNRNLCYFHEPRFVSWPSQYQPKLL